MQHMKLETPFRPTRIPQFHPRVELRIVMEDNGVDEIIRTVASIVKTGNLGDGKIFVLPVEEAVRIQTEEKGDQALF